MLQLSMHKVLLTAALLGMSPCRLSVRTSRPEIWCQAANDLHVVSDQQQSLDMSNASVQQLSFVQKQMALKRWAQGTWFFVSSAFALRSKAFHSGPQQSFGMRLHRWKPPFSV